MTRDEFNLWLKELRRRMPDTHTWLGKQGDTASVWFEDVFANLEYDVAISALSQVWREGLAPYERERLPAIISKKHGEICWKRKQDQQRAAEKRRQKETGTFYGDPIMVQAYQEARKLNHDPALRGSFVDQLFDDPDPIRNADDWLAWRENT